MVMIQIRNLRKSYGSYQALCGLTMEIGRGELFGFVGPNGAGKTTTMKIIAGLLRADSGDVFLAGKKFDGTSSQMQKKIGYVPDFFGVYGNLNVQEYMEFYASLYGITGKAAREKSASLLEALHISEWKEEMVDSMSRGVKQKLCVARALVNDPELLVLDEPSSGMEPKAQNELKELLQELCAAGKTVLISSHNLQELAETCSSIGIIRSGMLVAQGGMQDILMQQKEKNPFILQFFDFSEAAMAVLKSCPLAKSIAKKENSISFHFSGTEEEAADLLSEMVAAGAKITSFHREEGSLEKIFLEIISDGR